MPGWIDIETGTWGGDISTLRAINDETVTHLANNDLSDSEIKSHGHGRPHLMVARDPGYLYLPSGSNNLNIFARAVLDADLFGRDLRVSATEQYAKVKVGQGMWTPPIYGEDDPYRG